MKKRLIIISAGAFGREVACWAKNVQDMKTDWEIYGFLDNRPEILHGSGISYPILGTVEDYEPDPMDVFLCAIGDPKVKMHYCALIAAKGARFATLIHPTAVIGENCRIGEGCILCPYSVITTKVTLGNHVILNVHSSVGHDATIGEGSTLSGHCDVTGCATLGLGVFMGSHATVLPKANVEDNAFIGAGSVVLRRVKTGQTVFGVPARVYNF
jgi:sugar O-acyltransferase (sialic acid O-acetyltransferase NeuD family)